MALWCSGYYYCTTSFNKAWTQVLLRFKSCLRHVGDLRWWGSLTIVLATQIKVVTRKYVFMIRNKYIYSFWNTLPCSAITYVNVNYDDMPEMFGTWNYKEIILQVMEKKVNKICLRKKQEIVASDKVVLRHTFWVLKFLTLSNINWTHHQSKLNLFQEIPLTLLSSLEAFFTKCV